MISKEEVKSLIALKQAGVNRMRERQNPELIHEAIDKVKQRLENTGVATRAIYLRWYDILMDWPPERISQLLRGDSADDEQLRACAPFDFVKKKNSSSKVYHVRR